MRLLASFVMRGRWQAVLVAALIATFSLGVPPLSILSSAVVALVTLRQGMRAGLVVSAGAGLACVVLVAALAGTMAPVVGFLALVWMPAWLLAGVLRTSRSLALALQGALIFGVAVIAAYHAQYPDPVAEWRNVLGPFADHMVESGLLAADQRSMLVELMAPWMTGILAAVFYLQLVAALLLARWWQAGLYNPGGFRAEFHRLRFHRYLAYLSLPILVLLLMPGEAATAGLVNYAGLLLVAAYLVQGLAVAHGLAGQLGVGIGWLIGLYVLLILLPRSTVVLAVTGYLDAWLDFRARFRGKGGSGDSAI